MLLTLGRFGTEVLRDRAVEEPFDGWRAMRFKFPCASNCESYGATEMGEPTGESPYALKNGFAELAVVGVYACTTWPGWKR